jgi:hypothetical protein
VGNVFFLAIIGRASSYARRCLGLTRKLERHGGHCCAYGGSILVRSAPEPSLRIIVLLRPFIGRRVTYGPIWPSVRVRRWNRD